MILTRARIFYVVLLVIFTIITYFNTEASETLKTPVEVTHQVTVTILTASGFSMVLSITSIKCYII